MKDFFKKLLKFVGTGILLAVIIGFTVNTLVTNTDWVTETGEYIDYLDWKLLFDGNTYVYGFPIAALSILLYMIYHSGSPSKQAEKMLGSKGKAIEGGLENSRFMTDKERDLNFTPYKFTKLSSVTKDGIPVRAVCSGKREVNLNLAPPIHTLIIGATGSGKTTTFINPMIQILGKTSAGSSMIITDPKGELFNLHSQFLRDRGYNVMILDLRDPYSSFRWNPLEDMYDRYQEYIRIGSEIYKRRDRPETSGLRLLDPVEKYGEVWYEYEGRAYASGKVLLDEIKIAKQKIYDEVYEDLNDLVSVLCPIESLDDPVWEKGARSVILATALAMLEDSEFPELEMTKEKYNFFNINKAMGNSENNFLELRNYFAGRSVVSPAVTLSRQVLSAAENTLASYMSIAFDKLSMFNDEGLCSLTSATDINPSIFAEQPTALFLKVPDEKDTRHALAAVFILSIYKALIKKASATEDLTLPRNVYFILDEFGNMPKIEKFDKMITVGRSRKIWFTMVIQSYAQLNNVYGDKVAAIIKGNCGIKMFIGSNDIETCKEFSELCGNMTISSTSVSYSTGKDGGGQHNYSSQAQTRPLIYPSDLQKLNNRTSTGNSIIVSFGNYPLKTQFTPSYKCPLYTDGSMDLGEVRSHAFFSEEVYYDLAERNYLMLKNDENNENSDNNNQNPDNNNQNNDQNSNNNQSE